MEEDSIKIKKKLLNAFFEEFHEAVRSNEAELEEMKERHRKEIDELKKTHQNRLDEMKSLLNQ